jgi:hypothetical protein
MQEYNVPKKALLLGKLDFYGDAPAYGMFRSG